MTTPNPAQNVSDAEAYKLVWQKPDGGAHKSFVTDRKDLVQLLNDYFTSIGDKCQIIPLNRARELQQAQPRDADGYPVREGFDQVNAAKFDEFKGLQQAQAVGERKDALEAVGAFGIEVEKLLCAALGREWRPSGFSIESLIEELKAKATPQSSAPVVGEAVAEGGGDVSDHLIQSTAEPADGVEVRLRIGKKLLEEIDSAADWNDIVRDAMIRHMLQYALNTKPAAIESLSRQGGEAVMQFHPVDVVLNAYENMRPTESDFREIFDAIGEFNQNRTDGDPTRASEAGDWVLVPRECTDEMRLASNNISSRDEGEDHWNAMIAAAPAPGGE